MLRSLLDEVRMWLVLWRRRFALRAKLSNGSESAGYLLMFALPVIVLGSIVFLAVINDTPTIVSARVNSDYRRELALRCLAENVYYEARGEPLKGQYAVAEVTLNRMRSKNFPDSVCKVVHESRWDRIRKRFVAHFSWTENTRPADPAGPAWDQAMTVAAAVYDEKQEPVVPGALFYHATRIHPAWAKNKKPLATIGNHVFYK
jgi:spore germination cell wall hydrolase CwlJ-like protein